MKNKKLLLGLVTGALVVVAALVAFQFSGGEDLQGAFPGPKTSNISGTETKVDTDSVAGVFGTPCSVDECDLMDMLEDLDATIGNNRDGYTVAGTSYNSFMQTSLILDLLNVSFSGAGNLVSNAHGTLVHTSEILRLLDGTGANIVGNAHGSLVQTSQILSDLSGLETLINNVCGS